MRSGYTAVIAGTTEAKAIIETLIENKKEIAAFTATQLGTQMLQNYEIDIIEGRKNKEQFYRFFKAFKPAEVYDASHPFAEEVTKNVKEICERLQIPYIRVRREQTEYDYENIVYAKDTNEAIQLLQKIKGNILLTTGVKTAEEYYQAVDPKRLYIRVLESERSKKICREAGYEPAHVFAQNPPFSTESNEALIRRINAEVLVTKDSGREGGVPEKVEAAKRCGIPVIIIQRPEDGADYPRILIAAAGSGSGKTTVTLGLMKAFCNEGKKVQGYKCGPDYIDPMYHRKITGRPSINLDPFFLKEKMKSHMTMYGKHADLGILEGVMGFYDGIGSTVSGSTYEVSRQTGTAVILVLSVKGIANTIIPMIQGILNYRETNIRGILLNCCSKGFYEQIRPAIEEECGVAVVGYLPEREEIRFQSRHLGLYMADEIKNWQESIDLLSKQIKETVCLEKIYEIACTSDKIIWEKEKEKEQYPVCLAVAMDEAFCFYYEDNLKLLEEYGVRIVSFSPIHDERLPEKIQGIYIGGGYPELFAKQLEKNKTLRNEIRNWCKMGKPLIAECGGYMYLGKSLMDLDGKVYEMCGAFSHKTEMTGKLNSHFGYVTVFPDEKETETEVRAHEFHYSRELGDDFSCFVKKNEKRQWNSGYFFKNQYAAYPHIHFRGNEEFLEKYLEQMLEEMICNDSIS